jgi:hypothetical protein
MTRYVTHSIFLQFAMAAQEFQQYQSMPSFQLHRFASEPSDSDVQVFFSDDGVEMVKGQAQSFRRQLTDMAVRNPKQKKQKTRSVEGKAIEFPGQILGISLIQLDAEYIGKVYDIGFWEGTDCHVTKIDEPLGESFAIVPTHTYKHPPRLKRSRDAETETRKPVGVHFSLMPLGDMPKADLLQKLSDVKASVCRPRASAAAKSLADAWPPEVETPSDPLMVPAVYALRALRFSSTEQDLNVKVRAGLECITLSAENMYVGDLLKVPAQAAFVLYALDRYEPPNKDPYLVLKCDALSERLCEALYGDFGTDSSGDDSIEQVGHG